MSKPVETTQTEANDTARLVKAAKELQGHSLLVIMMIAMGARGEIISEELGKYKDVASELAKALRPFETEPS